jgi:hypothetical protein
MTDTADTDLDDFFPNDAEEETTDITLPKRGRGLEVRFDVPEDDEFPLDTQARFFERFAEGYQEWEIGLELGWSKAKVERFLNSDDRRDLLWMIAERKWEGVERAMIRSAEAGNVAAGRLVLFNKAKHRGWSDTRHVHVEAQSQREIIVSVRQAIDERIEHAALTRGKDGIAEIQNAFLDGDMDIIDAEVVGE